MDSLEKTILLYQNLHYFLQVKSFSLWMACFNSNVNDLDFVTKHKIDKSDKVVFWLSFSLTSSTLDSGTYTFVYDYILSDGIITITLSKTTEF